MQEPYRVIQWGAGNTGSRALRFLLDEPAFEVVGVWVGRERNIGRSAGELAGLSIHGPAATNDAEALLALDADCVVYMAAEPSRPPTEPGTDGRRSLDMICSLLASGKNVVCVGISGLTNPKGYGPEVYRRLADAASGAGSTFFATGIEPGFMCDVLALNLTSLSRDIRSVRVQEIISYATYDQPKYHVSHGGIWGAPYDLGYRDMFAQGVLAGGMGNPVRLLADALNLELDDITCTVELAAADRAFDIPMGPIAPGTVAGYRFEVLGLVKGIPAIVVEHVTRIDAQVAPTWPRLDPGGFRVQLEGTPSFTVQVVFDEDDANFAACTSTAARAVNSVPVVCRAPAGVYSFLELPPIGGTVARRDRAR